MNHALNHCALVLVLSQGLLAACGGTSTRNENLRHGAAVATRSQTTTNIAEPTEEQVYLVGEADLDTKIAESVANPKAVTEQIMAAAAAAGEAVYTATKEVPQGAGDLVVTSAVAAPPPAVGATTVASAEVVAKEAEKPVFDSQDKIYSKIHARFLEKLKSHPGSMKPEDVDFLSQQLAGFVHHGANKKNKDAAAYWNKFSTRVHELAKAKAAKKMGLLPILFPLGALVAAILAPAVALVAAVAAPILIAPVVAIHAAHNVIDHVFRVVG
ncbi:MAG: hypothetical protein FJ146_17290 [Deltaproteobacteria bacterium]|nr:hypothetical protein [Deltaproteobacteria bacterium]